VFSSGLYGTCRPTGLRTWALGVCDTAHPAFTHFKETGPSEEKLLGLAGGFAVALCGSCWGGRGLAVGCAVPLPLLPGGRRGGSGGCGTGDGRRLPHMYAHSSSAACNPLWARCSTSRGGKRSFSYTTSVIAPLWVVSRWRYGRKSRMCCCCALLLKLWGLIRAVGSRSAKGKCLSPGADRNALITSASGSPLFVPFLPPPLFCRGPSPRVPAAAGRRSFGR
jgi:hypothetical protein